MAEIRGYELKVNPNKDTIELAKKMVNDNGNCINILFYCDECFARVNPDGECFFHHNFEEKTEIDYSDFKVKLAKEYIAKFEVAFVQEELET